MNIEALRAQILSVRLNRPELTWAQIHQAFVPDPETVSATCIYRIGTDPEYEPKDPKIRAALGLESESEVTFVDGRPRPKSKALDVAQCACGNYYISNHPRRGRCFECSPYRGKKGAIG